MTFLHEYAHLMAVTAAQMELFDEYALLIVVASPVAVIVLMNLLLLLSGERETLLLPGTRAFPKVDIETRKSDGIPGASMETVDVLPSTIIIAPVAEAANAAFERPTREAA
jgi:hypothetical protein